MEDIIQLPLSGIGESRTQLKLDLPLPRRPRGNPSFKPKWKGPTKAIRLPEKYADTALAIFQRCDNDNIDPAKLSLDNLWAKGETQYRVDPVTGYKLAEVYLIPIDDLRCDPKRFQYKLIQYNSYGSTNSLSGVTAWDNNMAGTLLIWKDPDNNKNYVINGHNRYSLAASLGVEFLKCEFITAANAIEARAIGALRNIAEGQGTPIDAAKFFRDSNLTASEIKGKGYLPLTKTTVRDGMALANLCPALFNRLVEDRLEVNDGAIIGSSLDQDLQSSVIEALDKGTTGGELSELCTLIKASESQQIEQFSLFGTETFTVSNAIDRARKISWLKSKLARDKRIFATVGRNSEALRKGNNTIDKTTSLGIAEQSKRALALFDQLKLQAGPLASLINDCANGLISDDSYYSQAMALLSNPLAC